MAGGTASAGGAASVVPDDGSRATSGAPRAPAAAPPEASVAPGGDALAREVAALRERAVVLAGVDVSGLDAVAAASVHRELRSAIDRLGVVAARVLSVVEADGRWSASGARTFPEWVARRQGTSVGAARTEAALGRALEGDLPVTRSAVTAGSITLEHAQVLAKVGPSTPARVAALRSGAPDLGEGFLVEQARRSGVDEYRRVVARWAAKVDAAAADREHRTAAAAQHLTLSRRPDGVALTGFLTHDNGVLLQTALRAVIGVPSAEDARTPEQRQGEALASLAHLTLDRGLVGAGGQVRPHLSVHVSWETMQTLATAHPATGGTEGTGDVASQDTAESPAPVDPAELDDGTPLAPSVLARIACDSEITRIVFGPTSQVLDVGRAHRTYTGHLRRAVIARDRTCRYPGCTAPPNLGEIHHIQPWSQHGPTSITNGILLCWYHHDLVHQRRLRITRDTGAWQFRRPDGTPLTDQRARPPREELSSPPVVPPQVASPPGQPPEPALYQQPELVLIS